MNRQHARRAGQPFGQQRMGSGSATQSEMSFSARSPQGHPTPSSHASSPAALAQSPASLQHGGITPPASGMHGQQQHYGAQQPPRQRYSMQHPPQRVAPPVQYAPGGGANLPPPTMAESNSAVASAPSTYYPSPFQKHIEELGKLSRSPSRSFPVELCRPIIDCVSAEQEYDAQPSPMMNENEANEQSGGAQAVDAGHYRNSRAYQQHAAQGIARGPSHSAGPNQTKGPEGAGQGTGMNQVYESFDPMLDADPFGLSASMHFPTNYSFDQQPQR